MTGTPSTDRIEKQIDIAAPRSRVWHALTDTAEFGRWFGVRAEGRFEPGARVRGQLTHPAYTHVIMDIVIERVEPERLLSWRWHPYAVEPGVDYSGETPTTVTFTLEDTPGGTRLTVTESGFDRVPLARRAQAYRMNTDGWAKQVLSLERHVA